MCKSAEDFKLLDRKQAMTEIEVDALFNWLADNKFIDFTSYKVMLDRFKLEDKKQSLFIWKREHVWHRLILAERVAATIPIRTKKDEIFESIVTEYKLRNT